VADSLIAELTHEMDRGLIYEATLITDDGWHLEGIYDPNNQYITINPQVPIVAALLHELIHRRYPKLSERAVKRMEKRAMRLLSPKDIAKWYRRYRRTAVKRRPVDAIEYEG
jgi:hypothetical protein